MPLTDSLTSDGTWHLHLMLQFYKAQDRYARSFTFEGMCPNGQANDLLGEKWCGKKLQQSLDRGFFYVWADKEGTARDANNQPVRAGNYEPAWTRAKYNYPVPATFLDKLFKAYKLGMDTYEEYLFLSREGTGIPHRCPCPVCKP